MALRSKDFVPVLSFTKVSHMPPLFRLPCCVSLHQMKPLLSFMCLKTLEYNAVHSLLSSSQCLCSMSHKASFTPTGTIYSLCFLLCTYSKLEEAFHGYINFSDLSSAQMHTDSGERERDRRDCEE